jgi:3-(3-hydroxy-phenyl)propionate hydroxylase
VGWQLPQPWVIDAEGAKLRLDDVLGGGWTVLHFGTKPTGADRWERLGAVSLAVTGREPASGAIRDDGTLTRWLRRKKAVAVVVRPDGFVFGAAASGCPLPAPPAGLTELSAPVAAAPIGVSA